MLKESDIIRTLLRDRVKILSYLDSFLGDYQMAEDSFQEVCALAVAKVDFFTEETHLLRWALSVGRNKSIDAMRRRSRQPCVLDDEILEELESQWIAESSLPLGEDVERMEILKHCLGKLSENSRRIVDLRYVDGLKSMRIAEILGRKVESVYRALTRAHVALRECMERQAAAPRKPQKET